MKLKNKKRGINKRAKMLNKKYFNRKKRKLY